MNFLKKAINKILRALKPIFTFNKEKMFNEIKNEINFNDYKKIIIYENNFGWEGIMRQRPQQMALNYDKDTLFIYHSNRDKFDNKLNYKFIKKNLILINLDLYRKYLIKTLKPRKDKYLLLYSTDYTNKKKIDLYIENDFKIVYEYIDNIDEELSGKRVSKLLQKKYDYLVNRKDVYIVTTATKLYNNISNTNKKAKVTMITNGVDYDHFKAKKYSIPTDMKKIVNPNKKVIGYYGALASWFDYELIKKVAKDNKYNIVLIGMEYDNALHDSGILEFSNVYYLGKKDYNELPKYLCHFDICTIPFIINEITLSTSPVKVFEYMAALKPIVTTALPECMKYKSVLVSNDYDEFIENIKKCDKLMNDNKYKQLLKDEALENAWSNKCKDMIEFISYK